MPSNSDSKSQGAGQERPLTRIERQALEKLFSAEIDNRLPLQSNARIYSKLVDDGLAQTMVRHFGEGWSAVTVHGFQLTHAGRFAYCSGDGVEMD